MLQARGELDLVQEAPSAEERPDVRPQHLDRDLALMFALAREVHGRCATAAELPLDGVALAQQCLQLREGMDGARHGTGTGQV